MPAERPRNGHAHSFHQSFGVLFGGYAGFSSITLNHTWEWTGSNLVQKTPANAPLARWSNGMVYDRARQRMVLFGGYSPFAPGVGAMNNTWE